MMGMRSSMSDRRVLGRRAARAALAVFGVLIALLTGNPAAQALAPRPICDVCRRFTDKSPARVVGYIEIGNHSKKLDACSPFCFVEMLEDQVTEPDFIRVADYATFGTENHIPLTADQAWYLYDCDTGDEENTNQPYTYAFTSEDNAREYQQDLGGELLKWDDVVDKLTELTDEWEPPGSSYEYRPLNGKRHHHKEDKDDDGDDG